ncbi:MAG: response regulator [Lachnospiraceae bacterium]|nr:response regulator [Lachnospiraceae bacterium]
MKSKKHILIVDDVTTNLRYIGEVLKENYILSMAKSGEQVFKILEKARPDLILLDIKMPQMDGFTVFSKLSSDEKFNSIPVIFLSGDNQEENEVKGIELGAKDFIRKPFDPDDMVLRIERALKNERS